jgi:sialic acid synthase SpsE
VRIGDFDTSRQVFVIAEIGNNHEGDFATAREMVRSAAEAGADAVKFQTFVPERFVSSSDPARLERLRGFQLSYAQFEQLAALASDVGVIFFSTPLDIESARFLNGIQPVFKIASGDNTFFPLIEEVAAFGKPLIISTGLATIPLLTRIRDDVHAIWRDRAIEQELAFLHCVASYPVPPEQAAIGAIRVLESTFPDCVIGYSDHTLGIDTSLYAVAAGARIIEKHFTLDKNHSDFRDHQLSAEPEELRRLVQGIRALTLTIGEADKSPQPCEDDLRVAARRSIAAARDITQGSVLVADDLTWLRPGSGLPPGDEHKLLGRATARPLNAGELIHMTDLVDGAAPVVKGG